MFLDDSITKAIYSVDASIYEITPTAILQPKNVQEIITAVHHARTHNIPVIARGGGTGIAGGCLGEGIIIDTSRYLNRILEINPQERYAICEPGVIQDDLNQKCKEFGLRLGPETSTGNRATLGGMVGANAAGSHYLRYGNMADHLLEVEMILSNGEVVTLGKDAPPYIEKGLQEIALRYREEINNHMPQYKRRASGYQIDSLLQSPLNFATLLAGSEGTLGLITKVKVRLCPLLKTLSHTILCFDSLDACLKMVPHLLNLHPLSIELLDHHVIEMGRLSPGLRERIKWLQGDPQALLFLDFESEIPPHIASHQKDLSSQEASDLAALRKAGLGLLLSRRSYSRALAFIEDCAVPPVHLHAFIKDLTTLLTSHNKTAGIYGHAGDGCLHIRPYIDLRKESEGALLLEIQEKVTELVKHYGGVLSSEHGDGLIRTWLNSKLFGEKLYHAFLEIKYLFDPLCLMNPGKKVGKQTPNTQWRTPPQREIKTFLNFDKEGGFALAADLCNGNGECRKKTTLMCPSFHAESDERLTTRARAQSLRAILNGKLPLEELSGKGLHEVLDLCLECKGCKRECPSQVDMAKMKAEVLFHYQQKHGVDLSSRLFGHLGDLFKLLPFPSFYNQLRQSSLLKDLLKVARERNLPKLAQKRFSKYRLLGQGEGKKVVLFIDTFTEFFEPYIGLKAFQLLSSLGFHVIVPSWRCCGRTHLSKGLLKEARSKAEALVEQLSPYAELGLPIIGLEPSCLLTLKDDYEGLLSDKSLEKIISLSTTLDEFLIPHLPLPLSLPKRPLLVHTHCHQKALVGSHPTLTVLRSHFDVSEIDSGCCGMAGSWGYEKAHYEMSMKIGLKTLFPAILHAPPETLIIASGFSCRHQILEGTGRRAYHLAEALTFH